MEPIDVLAHVGGLDSLYGRMYIGAANTENLYDRWFISSSSFGSLDRTKDKDYIVHACIW